MTLSELGQILKAIEDGMKHEFEMFGFKMSFWGIMLTIMALSLILWALGEVINGD